MRRVKPRAGTPFRFGCALGVGTHVVRFEIMSALFDEIGMERALDRSRTHGNIRMERRQSYPQTAAFRRLRMQSASLFPASDRVEKTYSFSVLLDSENTAAAAVKFVSFGIRSAYGTMRYLSSAGIQHCTKTLLHRKNAEAFSIIRRTFFVMKKPNVVVKK